MHDSSYLIFKHYIRLILSSTITLWITTAISLPMIVAWYHNSPSSSSSSSTPMDNNSNIVSNDYDLVPYSTSSSSSSTPTSRSASPVSTSGSTPPPLSPVTPLDPTSKHLRSRPIKPTNRFNSEGQVRKQGKKHRTRSNTKDIQKLSKSQLQKIVQEMLDCRVKVPRVCQREMDHQVVTGRAEGTDSTIEIIRSVPTEPLDYVGDIVISILSFYMFFSL